jgi:methylated-DNA-[protein]-cysteine S-methyltransferase
MNVSTATFPTPLGNFSVAIDAAGAVVATAFGGAAALAGRRAGCHPAADRKRTAGVRRQIGEYFAGRRRGFELALAPGGTPFQQRVWAALAAIPYGQTVSYGELAARLGAPRSARAVGRACGANPVCLLVPCHRVVGADGSLTGFAFGARLKARLLAREGGKPATHQKRRGVAGS